MPTALTPTGAPSLFGGIGKLEFAPTNGPDDPFPTWVDITVYLRTESTALTITRGRQSELDTIQPSQLTAILDNTDGRFTFGLTTGPYGANWTPAKKVRYSETIGQRTFVLFTGWIEFPDIDSWQPIGYQEVSLTCTDRLTRLGRGQPFPSALGAYILNTPDLKGYWPMTDAAPPFRGIGPSTDPMVLDRRGAAQVLPRQGVAPPGGEGSALRLLTAGFASQENAWISLPTGFLPDVGVTDSLTVVMWNAVTGTASATQKIMSTRLIGTGQIALDLDRDLSAGTWTLAATGAMTATITAGAVGTALFPVGIRFTMSPANMELWIGGQRFTTTPTGTPQVGEFLNRGEFGVFPIDFDISHVQVYIGQTYAYRDFQAQITQGYTPLEYQTTGQRINTILDYAGVPSTDRAVDPGVSYMQAAKLAGQTPQAALQNAVTTERGRGFAAGDGRYVFHDRTRVMNV